MDEATELATDDPGVVKHLSAELRAALRSVETGETGELAPGLLVEAAAVLNAFAATRLLEFVYIPPEESGSEEDVAVFGVSEAAVIEDAPDSISMFGYLDRATDPVPVLAYEDVDEDADEPAS